MEFNNLKNESGKLRMTPAEKTAMKARIFGMPAPAHLAPKQPVPGKAEGSPYFIFTYQFMQARVLAPLAVVLVVFVGAGTAAAAHSSLPGDMLYRVKLSINEPVEIALATTPVAKAQVQARQAVRRVEEAEVLASRGELTPQGGEALAANFEAHAQSASELVGEVEAEDPAAAESLRAKLGSSLEAHGAILATLTVGGARANQEGAGAVAARVLARADSGERAAATMRVAKAPAPASAQTMTMSLSVASDTAASAEAEAAGAVSLEADVVERASLRAQDEGAAQRLKARAERALVEAREQFEDSKAELAGSAITQVSGEFAAIEQLVELGSTTFATRHYAEARGDFTEALKRAIKLQVLLGVQSKLQQNIISPILEKTLETDSSSEVNVLPAGI